MKLNRMEAFSDGVLAIIITIMVLEFKAPEDHAWSSLVDLVPKLLSYAVSFIYVGIYWNNHHHLLHTVHFLYGRLMWLNLLLLFWLSLVPFSTAWIGESSFSSTPTAFYGIVLLFTAIAYSLLQHAILKQHSSNSAIAVAMGKDFKGKLSILFYIVAIPTAYLNSWISCFLIVLVAAIWFVPDQRIERVIKSREL
ncbi:TMEM175 family protein [Paenibacillus sp. YAF4_2]|uniref:TMEM175 family protein n=1 Tax=Paenibacillus sp. YAF4_2 TaxID=3233085 RepID=UPI003F9657A5